MKLKRHTYTHTHIHTYTHTHIHTYTHTHIHTYTHTHIQTCTRVELRNLITTALKFISVRFQDVTRKKEEMQRIHSANRLPGKFEDLWLAYVLTISRSYGVVYLSKGGSKNGVGHLPRGKSEKKFWVAESVPLVDMANTDVLSKINTKWGYNNMEGAFYLNATKMVISTRTASRQMLWRNDSLLSTLGV
jgi:hypothetical protein